MFRLISRTRSLPLAALGLTTMFAFASPGCEKEGPLENAGENLDEAVDDAGDAIEDAGDKVEEALEGGG